MKKNTHQNLTFAHLGIFVFVIGLLPSFLLEAKDPPNLITFKEGGIQKTFYRNPNIEAEFIEPNQVTSAPTKSYANKNIKAGWNFRSPGKSLIKNKTKSATETKVTEVYNPGNGYGPNIVLPGIVVVSFQFDQSKEAISQLAKKYNVQVIHIFHPRLASFQSEPGYLSVEKANELLNESSILEAYPETAVEKVLK